MLGPVHEQDGRVTSKDPHLTCRTRDDLKACDAHIFWGGVKRSKENAPPADKL